MRNFGDKVEQTYLQRSLLLQLRKSTPDTSIKDLNLKVQNSK